MRISRLLLAAVLSGLFLSLVFSQTKVKTIQMDVSIDHDSLVYKALSLGNENKKRFNLSSKTSSDKCGLAIQFEILKRKKSLSKTDQVLIDQIFSRDLLDTSIVSNSGVFRVHFDKNGINAPAKTDNNQNSIPDYVDSVAYYFDYCNSKIVNTLGFEGLLTDNGAGGGNEYDIYIKDLSSGTYGYTTFEESVEETNSVPRYTTYITIDNNFDYLYTSGFEGLKITAGHELFHAIQIGRYGAWMEDIYYYEILSTWMETYLFPEVKDYYQYLQTFFTTTNKPFWKHSGYDLTLWGLFLSNKYSPHIMKNILEGFKKYSPFKASEYALNREGSSMVNEYADFSNWIFFTSYRTKDGFYFKNAKEYPTVSGSSLKLINYLSPSCSINAYMLPFTTQFYSIKSNSDTINIISLRTNLNEAFEKQDNYGSGSFQISDNISDSKSVSLVNGLKSLFTCDAVNDWKTFYLINNDFVLSSNEVKVYPSPVVISENAKMNFNIPVAIGSEAQLFVFSNDMRLIYETKKTVAPIIGGNGLEWNCKDTHNKTLSSGIYFYFIKTNTKEWKNKFAVIRKK